MRKYHSCDGKYETTVCSSSATDKASYLLYPHTCGTNLLIEMNQRISQNVKLLLQVQSRSALCLLLCWRFMVKLDVGPPPSVTCLCEAVCHMTCLMACPQSPRCATLSLTPSLPHTHAFTVMTHTLTAAWQKQLAWQTYA